MIRGDYMHTHMEQSHAIEETLAVLLVLGWFVTPDLASEPSLLQAGCQIRNKGKRQLDVRGFISRKTPGKAVRRPFFYF